MNKILVLIFLAAYATLWFAMLRYDIMMYQQNSYRFSRYRRWLFKSYKPQWAAIIAALAIACWILTDNVTGLAIIFMLYLSWQELKVKYKKPLVYTMRVKRLFTTAAIITLAAIVLSFIYIPHYMPAVALGLLALPVLMLGADVINRPVEKYIVRRYYREAQQILASMPRLKVIGVTGSFGKTSTKNYLYRILSEKYNVLMTPGNYNTTLGVVRTVREQLKPYHDIFIVEMGAKQPGDIREICDLVHPTIGIVTAVGEMHLETFHTVENILHTKFELLNALPEEGLGVVNLDSQPIAASDAPHDKRIVTYAVHNTAADYRAVDINYTSKLTDFSVATREGVRTGYATQLAGRGNILNLLAAIVVADRLGVEEALQKRAMRRIEQIEHRLSINRASGGVTVIDDAYNSNPAGARMALEVLRDFAVDVGGRRIVVTPGFVELGERQAELNRQFGRDMAKACDIVVVVNLTNREAITQGLTEAGFPAECIHQTASFTEASAFLLRTLTQGDVILYENDLPDSFR